MNELFAPGLITRAIDLDAADMREQVSSLMGLDEDYVALTRRRVYEGVATRLVLDGLVLRQLLAALEE